MDALALLSDDEDGEETAAGADDADEAPPSPKRARMSEEGMTPEPTLSFEALQRAGFHVLGDNIDEQKLAEASLKHSFEALEQASKEEAPKPEEEPKPVKKQAEVAGEYGCELPPDSIDVYDEQGREQEEPWTTFDEAQNAKNGLDKRLVDVMKESGFEAPTPIQANTWPILSSGRDLIGVAKTGSGKTLAFLLPFFSRLLREGLKPRTVGEANLPAQMVKNAAGPGAYSPDVLVLAPSRELAVQIEAEANKFTSVVGISALACYGGEGLRRAQLGRLREQPQVVVGTVGRLNDFLENEKHWFGIKTVRFLVLDEADHMIGEGLNSNIRKITCDVDSPHRQTALFSATFPDDVSDLATWITRHAVEVRVGMRDPLRANRDVDQRIMIVKDDTDKEGALKTLLRKQYGANAKNPGKVLIFAGDPDECDMLHKKLKMALNHANVEVLHGNRKQADREKAMAAFRSGEAPILLATNVAGRGLDVKDVNMVINYEPPEDGQDYVHRIGRTGRAGRKGIAYTMLRKGPDGRAMIYIAQVMRRTGLPVPKELVDALKQRRGRDMGLAAEVLQGLCSFTHVERSWN
mmetsp:Transcript_37446/g.81354  ORF Transcript_37446/g.81354 Transcript_37446/m.81354 type:complete len:579 (-) Transcript_37446:79-1815(-)